MGSLNFYHDEPLFGLDIGHSTLKVMQLQKEAGKQPVVLGYGISSFDPEAIENGVIVNVQSIADSMHELFERKLAGHVASRRVACSLPTTRTFSRPLTIPLMDHDDIVEAMQLEAEQYIPIPLDSLYIDYEISRQDTQVMELLLVATPRKIVDSYLKILELLDLEPVAFEPSISAVSRLIQLGGSSSAEPTIIVDVGSVTTDIAIFDKTPLVTTTVNSGSDTITDLISKNMHLNREQAGELKNEYGISYSSKQQRIIDAIKPQLENLIREIQKTVRYYSERAAKSGKKISRVVTVGGGAIMPGFNQYLSKELRLPVDSFNPWQKISFGHLPLPPESDLSTYVTAAGEAILNSSEVLA